MAKSMRLLGRILRFGQARLVLPCYLCLAVGQVADHQCFRVDREPVPVLTRSLIKLIAAGH